ncbi:MULTISPECIES: biopolymer transporter ExbD [unclassified Nitratiruptor]|uniref:ExbD/TolR family protein n=1 Tax=unclassified Nitratiruptor TaxID=2624044 RepID=UPI0001587141|nr:MULTISPECIES: biopolymer transporter ExbD [unclassified Nitratiruptor]BAF70326.1 biopolymer transport protein, ExbD/TolR family [Nitratiruptor sp. SB155-2]BCD60060.1 biopolymer transport protein ExbD [Nitratiruptor sp. YY08-10]BCD64451.1 biopolymer transport protein ExbD [Nitratiruptor sp. YY08-14]
MFDWDEKPELNITPLVDVMLVLLAILMVAAPAIVYQEDINLPQGSKTKSYQKVKSIQIKITKDKTITVGKERLNYKNFADSFIMLANRFDRKTPVYIAADKSLRYGDIMYVLKVVKEAGFSKVSLITNG